MSSRCLPVVFQMSSRCLPDVTPFITTFETTMTKISAVIITFNEERNIARCLQSVKDVADEVVVVDSYSTDRTEEICRSFGVVFIQNEWLGYSGQKNYANAQASYDHILSIDADEALSETLREEIIKQKETDLKPAYEMNRMTNYCGHWIRYGSWYPDRQLRLFSRKTGRWDGEKIHEKFRPDDGITPAFLKGDLLHFSYYSIHEHLGQANHFTTLTAEVAFSRGKKAPLFKVLLSPFFRFIRDYFLMAGFLDGYPGFLVARISAFASFLKYSKIRQIHKETKTKTAYPGK